MGKFEEALKKPAARRLIRKLEHCEPLEFQFCWEQLGDEIQDQDSKREKEAGERFFREEELLSKLRARPGVLEHIEAAVKADARGAEKEAFESWVQAFDEL